MSAVEFRYNIDTQMELYRQEIQPLGRLLEASRKTFVLTKDNSMKLIKDLGTRYTNKNSKNKQRYGLYECPVCGDHVELRASSVKSGNTTKCKKHRGQKHNGVGTRLYSIHKNMKARCYNKNVPNYKYYGMLGISICSDWFDFSNFREWALSNGYDETLTIDRIDSDCNYSPSNCRWATKTVQARNSKNRNSKSKSGFIGVTPNMNNTRWVASITVNDKPIHIGVYDTKEEAALARDKYVLHNGYEHTLNFERGT